MKKFSKLAIMGGALALLLSFGFVSCSDSGSDDSSSTNNSAVDNGGSGNQVIENYTLDISKIPDKTEATSAKVDDTISVYASASNKKIEGKTTYVQMTGGKGSATFGAEYGLQITLTKAATITITALSKESKSACQWTLANTDSSKSVDSTGTPAVAAAKSDVTTTTPATLTFNEVPAGTYYLGAKSDGGYLTSLKIEY